MKVSTLNVDFSSLSLDSITSRRLAHASVKKWYSLKNGFTDIGSCSVKTVADRYRHVAYHNKHWSRAF